MGKCINHPDRETSYLCMKHNIYMCEECMKCRDPKLYCKYRTSCPIWFMSKGIKETLQPPAEEVAQYTVTFQPDETTVDVHSGETLLDAARKADIYINSSCNGKGVCGKCKLIVTSGEVEKTETPLLSDSEKEKGYVLACLTKVKDNINARIPEDTIQRKLKVAGMGDEATAKLQGLVKDIRPMLVKIPLELSPPTLDDSASDLDRLKSGLKKKECDISRLSVGLKVMRELADSLRDKDWQVTASVMQKDCSSEVVAVEPGDTTRGMLGLAIDIGTTTIVVYLVDMSDGVILAAAAGHNQQSKCGDDVINRIICAEKKGVEKLSGMVLSTINNLIEENVEGVSADYRNINNIVISGNTTMIHLLMKLESRYIRREPFIPSISSFPILKNEDVGLKTNPNAAVFIVPGPAGYVGGDIVAGVLHSGLYCEDELTLFIDVGTNGEIVLGNKDWMMCASCSAGPAFEGGGIRWGMRAEEGAIEGVKIDGNTYAPAIITVGDKSPRGICGTGMIELISEMMLSGIIDQSGKFKIGLEHPRMKNIGDESGYILSFAEDTPMDEDIVFTESDIDNLLRSKGAVYAGFSVLLKQAGIDFSTIDRVFITGGFGQYLDIEKCIIIGLLPDIDRDKFKYLGNSSIAGAYITLMSNTYIEKTHDICNSMTYVDFSTNPGFMDEFVSALFLPHTNLDSFPSVIKKLQQNVK